MIQCCGSEAELLTQICRSISELAGCSLPAVGPAIRPTAPNPSGHTAPRMDVSSLLEVPHPIASVLSFFLTRHLLQTPPYKARYPQQEAVP